MAIEQALSAFDDHVRYCLFGSVRQGKMDAFTSQRGSNLRRPATVLQLRALARPADNLHVLPCNPTTKAGSDGFHACLLGGKAGGQALSSIELAATVTNFFCSKHALEKAFAVTLQRAPDSRDFRDVNTGAKDHRPQVTGYRGQGTRRSHAIAVIAT